MTKKVVIDPITRIEGHLKIEVVVDNQNVVKEAYSSGTLFRGIELILKNRDPRDATQIVQRICGVCPICHAVASSNAIEDACKIKDKLTLNALLIRNLILGSNYLQSHILHFYLLALPDFVKLPPLPPFYPQSIENDRFDQQQRQVLIDHYIKALEIRRKTHEMLSIFGGKMPHNVGILAGGVTANPTVDKITNFLWRLNEIREFINNVYLPDVILIAKTYTDYYKIGTGCKNFLAYNAFNEVINENITTLYNQGCADLKTLQYNNLDFTKITEDVKFSFYDESFSHKHPKEEETLPQPDKPNAYSWLKAPRYDNKVYEVGPLARVVVNYLSNNEKVKKVLDDVMSVLNIKLQDLPSVLGRHIARVVDAKIVADSMAEWVLKLNPEEPFFTEFDIPDEAEGFGFTEAPRGALLHYIKIKNKLIDKYQCVVPTTWNASPKDDNGQPGAIEQAILGTKVSDSMVEVLQIVRSFDPCLACAVHVVDIKGNTIRKFSSW